MRVEPLERVESLEITAERGVHPGAVEDGLLPVEVDELLEGERVSHEVGGGVTEALLVLGIDSLAHVCGEVGCRQASSLSTSSVEMAWRSRRPGVGPQVRLPADHASGERVETVTVRMASR
jgi:hypothetical protein